jgi:hypothetical protein
LIESIADLRKVLRLLREQGVTEFEHNGTKLKLGDLPADRPQVAEVPAGTYANFPDGELTPEQLMFYSSGGMPEDDPALKREAS